MAIPWPLEDFAGVARLFPLPNLVLFPFVVQGLHIFEPRYRQLTADALAGDRLIALALLRPGWEEEYAGQPPLHPVVCLGQIIADERLGDGRYNLQLRGLARARIAEEMVAPKLYRTARVEVLPDINMPSAQKSVQLRRRLDRQLTPWYPALPPPAAVAFRKLLRSKFGVGMICDILGFALPLPLTIRQAMLEAIDVTQRAQLLSDHLEANAPDPTTPVPNPKFPPDFSAN